jgi:hypothetical protein
MAILRELIGFNTLIKTEMILILISWDMMEQRRKCILEHAL